MDTYSALAVHFLGLILLDLCIWGVDVHAYCNLDPKRRPSIQETQNPLLEGLWKTNSDIDN